MASRPPSSFLVVFVIQVRAARVPAARWALRTAVAFAAGKFRSSLYFLIFCDMNVSSRESASCSPGGHILLNLCSSSGVSRLSSGASGIWHSKSSLNFSRAAGGFFLGAGNSWRAWGFAWRYAHHFRNQGLYTDSCEPAPLVNLPGSTTHVSCTTLNEMPLSRQSLLRRLPVAAHRPHTLRCNKHGWLPIFHTGR